MVGTSRTRVISLAYSPRVISSSVYKPRVVYHDNNNNNNFLSYKIFKGSNFFSFTKVKTDFSRSKYLRYSTVSRQREHKHTMDFMCGETNREHKFWKSEMSSVRRRSVVVDYTLWERWVSLDSNLSKRIEKFCSKRIVSSCYTTQRISTTQTLVKFSLRSR